MLQVNHPKESQMDFQMELARNKKIKSMIVMIIQKEKAVKEVKIIKMTMMKIAN